MDGETHKAGLIPDIYHKIGCTGKNLLEYIEKNGSQEKKKLDESATKRE